MKSKHDDMSVKHWEKRPEAKWETFKFSQPYGKGLKRLREEVLDKTNFDPAVLWQWGTMQAMAVLEILKAVEVKFDREGQEIVFDAMRRVGLDMGRQILKDAVVPEGLTEAEFHSFYATVINRIAYASLETPQIDSEDCASFHIDWCPHQDQYGTFDCRVQRYFVQGIIDAATEFTSSLGYEDNVWDIFFKETIPAGSETCFFVMESGNEEESRKWEEYTKGLEHKALELAKR